MAERLTKDELKEIKESFSELDVDGDGKITKVELTSILCQKSGRYSERDAETMMRMCDINQDGTINFEELSKIMALFRYGKLQSESDIRLMFQALEKDVDGNVSVDEIKRAWKIFLHPSDNISKEEMNDIIKDLDVNSDGKINYDKFVKHMV